jgi:hypothetical protein
MFRLFLVFSFLHFYASFITENMNEALKVMIVLPFYLRFMKDRCLYKVFLIKAIFVVKPILLIALKWLIDYEVCFEFCLKHQRSIEFKLCYIWLWLLVRTIVVITLRFTKYFFFSPKLWKSTPTSGAMIKFD